MEYKWDSSKTINENAKILGISYNIAYQYAKTRKLTYQYEVKGKLNIDRKCAKCKKVMLVDNFYHRGKYKEKQLYKSYCKDCYNNRIYPEKTKARRILHLSVINNKIFKPNICSVCNIQLPKNKIHGHHPDYDKPLNIIWVCNKCHVSIHKNDKAQKL